MKVVGIIPSRYQSTRFPGKPLADICGKPMIWWVYKQAEKVKGFNELYVATDDERISSVCKKYGMNFIMTSNSHPEHISRVHEVSEKIQSDYYVCINGDEPLLCEQAIQDVIPNGAVLDEEYIGGMMRSLTDPAETIDSANIKLVVNLEGMCLYMSRTPVPYPKGSLLFNYKKYMGIECFNKKALNFFVSTPKGIIEEIEDLDHLRFIENGKKIFFRECVSDSLSVDTPKDLEKVKKIIESKQY